MTRARNSGISMAIVMLVLGVAAAPQQKPAAPVTAEALMGAALHQEEVEGNLETAIATYKRVIADAGASRSLKATALLHLGRSYEKLGDAEARKAYERLAREFADQLESATTARTRLAAMQSATTVPQAGQIARQIWAGNGANEYASVSPDGRHMSFMGFGVDDLGVRDLLTGTIRRLTNTARRPDGSRNAFGEYSVISRDGRQVAYVWNTPVAPLGFRGRSDLRILPLTGGEAGQPRIVYRSDETSYFEVFDWTPNGQHLLVVLMLPDRTWQIAFISSADGSVRALKTLAVRARNSNNASERPDKVSLSPDGRHVAYDLLVRDGESARDIFVLNADGSQDRVVVEHRANDRMPVWSADGSQLLFVSNRSGKDALWRVPIVDGRPTGPAVLVREELGDITPLGTTRSGGLYYVVGGQRRSNVHIAELDAAMKLTGAPAFATGRFVGSNGAPAWSHDGQYLAYHAIPENRSNLDFAGAEPVLVIRTLKTGEERDVPLSLQVDHRDGLKWFPDGRSLLVVARARTPEQGRHHVFYRVDVASGRAEPLLSTKGTYFEASDPALSPDGRTIFFIHGDDNERPSRQLVRFDLDGRREAVLKRGRLVSGAVAISPDGAEVAYVVMNPSTSRMGIEVMPAAGGEPRQVSLGTSQSGDDLLGGLTWSPDRRFLLFVRGTDDRPRSLWRVAATGGEPENMGISGLLTPRLHPDGRRIAFDVPENLRSSVWMLENFLPKTGTAR